MSILIILIKEIFFIALLTHLWFNTDFFPEYCLVLKKFIPKAWYSFLLIDQYHSRSGSETEVSSYIEYLLQKYYFSNQSGLVFVLKLLYCPICLTVWLSILFSVFTVGISYIAIIFFFSRLADYFLKFFLKIYQ